MGGGNFLTPTPPVKPKISKFAHPLSIDNLLGKKFVDFLETIKFNTIMVKILFNIYMEVIISRSEIDENPSIYSRYNPEKEQSAIFLGTFSRGGVGEIRGG